MGGTFDPIHNGHVALAEAAVECAGLDRVLLIPSSQPPHRPPARASIEDRLAMCRLAAAGHPRLEVSEIETRRAGPSYTLDTLQELHRERYFWRHLEASIHRQQYQLPAWQFDHPVETKCFNDRHPHSVTNGSHNSRVLEM